MSDPTVPPETPDDELPSALGNSSLSPSDNAPDQQPRAETPNEPPPGTTPDPSAGGAAAGSGIPGPPPPPPGGNYPPPPPGGGYQPLPAGQPKAFSSTDALVYGWNGFKNNIGPLVVIGLVLVAASAVINFLGRGFDIWIISITANLLGIFVSLVISLGLIRAALMILDGRKPTVEQLISTDNIGPYLVASIVVSVLTVVGLILCIIPGLIVAFLVQFYGYAIVDGKADGAGGAPSSDPIGAIRTSIQIVMANLGQLILLMLLILVVNFAGALLCGVGLLVSLPVTAIALAYAWRSFSAGPIAVQN